MDKSAFHWTYGCLKTRKSTSWCRVWKQDLPHMSQVRGWRIPEQAKDFVLSVEEDRNAGV